MGKPKIIAIVGPTSSGKTALGVWLAKQIQKGSCKAEIISADSRQVYKGLIIGTGKVTKKEMQGVPHHLLDVASPRKQFTVDAFVRLAEKAYASVLQKTAIAIVVGGTGLYVDTFLGRMSYPAVEPNPALRARLETKTVQQLFAQLTKLDPRRAQNIEPAHKRRLIRAIEIAKAIGKSPLPTPEQKYEVLWLGLNPPQEVLHQKISARLRARIKQGMIKEAKQLHAKGLSYKRMEELGLEYRFLAQYLRKESRRKVGIPTVFDASGLDSAIKNYAKRQVRWFKRNPNIVWVASNTEALQLAKAFLISR